MRGNYGLTDQVAALHWIQENIAQFGGDANNVTLMGHGNGDPCVNLLMSSPMATNLFSHIILMNGSPSLPWALSSDTEMYAKHLAKILDCPSSDNVLMVNCLRGKPVEQIMRVDSLSAQHLIAFGPIVDGIVVPSIPDEMIAKIPTINSNNIPSSNDYGHHLIYDDYYKQLNGDFGKNSSYKRQLSGSFIDTNSNNNNNKTRATAMIMEQNSYSTWLSVTIAIGVSLLILNMLVFAGVYYQLNKARASKAKDDTETRHNRHLHTHHNTYNNQFSNEVCFDINFIE